MGVTWQYIFLLLYSKLHLEETVKSSLQFHLRYIYSTDKLIHLCQTSKLISSHITRNLYDIAQSIFLLNDTPPLKCTKMTKSALNLLHIYYFQTQNICNSNIKTNVRIKFLPRALHLARSKILEILKRLYYIVKFQNTKITPYKISISY